MTTLYCPTFRCKPLYIGKAGSIAFLEAVEMLRNRTSISALEQVLHTLELARLDLVEEATRINERQ